MGPEPGTPRRGPPTGIHIPDDVLDGLPFAALDAGLPLLLLPVRIESRYRLDATPPELRIRIFPDQVHIDASTPAPGPAEARLTREFWRAWLTAPDERGRTAAWRGFVQRAGRQRAGWLARLLRPETGPGGRLVFPPAGSAGHVPARPVLLPRQWLAVGYSDQGLLFSQAGTPIARGLRTGPDPSAAPHEVAGSGLHVDEGLAWMVDYDRAVEAGMAVTVPLTGRAAPAADGVATLLVVGVDARLGPAGTARELGRLLDAHARTEGLAFVPQGTPTNNTATATSGWTPGGPVPAEPDGAPTARAPAPAAGPPGNAAVLGSALGIEDTTTLRLAAHGTDPERERSRAMVRALFETVLGTFTRRLLRVGPDIDGVAPPTVDTLREWTSRWVTGGAPLPTIAIGPQPYGVLPVCRWTAAARPATTAEHVQDVISLLIGEWRQAAASGPVLDPDLIDHLPDGEAQSRIATILASLPHPARLFTRWADQFSSLNDIDNKLSPQGLFWLFLTALDPQLNPAFATPLPEIVALYSGATLHNPVETIDQQIAAWQAVARELPGFLAEHAGLSGSELDSVTEDALSTLDVVLGLLDGWKARQDPVASLALDRFEGILGDVNTQLIEARFGPEADEWGELGLVQAPDAAPGHTAADYLADLRDRFRRRGDTLPPSGLDAGFLARQPLLYQLLDATLGFVPDQAAENAAVAGALGLLAGRPPEELEWLLRETLGLGIHRLDAWSTALAAERLDRMRAERPAGLQAGAFGWVTGLTPQTTERPSAGFVHAPSMAHAVTAAVLRSGWLAHGDTSPLAPAAVDVRSHRVRDAMWLLDGVRQGQELGDLLGYQFERQLHDLGADQHIRPVRQLVLRLTGRHGVPPDDPVDGIELLDLARAGRLGDQAPAVRTALGALEASFDATVDVGLFEAVHQLTGANLDRATALLDALATGTSPPPELAAVTTPRASVPVEHRVLVVLGETAPHPGRGWAVSGERDTLAPGLAAWAASLLPDAATVGFGVGAPDPDGTAAAPVLAMTLDALGLSALDALWLAGDDPDAVPAPLLTLAAGAAGMAVTIDPAGGDAPVTLREFTVLAVELRRAIDGLRVADARDLLPAAPQAVDPEAGTPDVVDPEADDSDALAAAAALVASFRRLVGDLGDALERGTSADVAPAVTRLARLGLATGHTPDDLAGAAELLPAARRRLARVAAVKVDPADRRSGLEERLAALLGGRVPLPSLFTLDGTAVDLRSGQPGPDDVDDWLDAAGRVRPALARIVEAGMLSELLDPAAGLRAVAGQYPREPGEGWAATSLPATRGGRLSVVALTGPGGIPAAGTRCCGLVVDRWSEQIPAVRQVTSATFQFDAPGNRPPQAWLLAVPPDGEPWSLSLVLDTLLETLEWAALRAVAPEDLPAFGRAVPTVFAPGTITAWPASPDDTADDTAGGPDGPGIAVDGRRG